MCRARSRKRAGGQIFCWWPYSFLLTLWVLLSFLYSIYLSPLFSSFSSSSQVPSPSRGWADILCIHISFLLFVMFFSLAHARVGLSPFILLFLPTWILGNQFLENMGMTLSVFMSLWKETIYFVLLQLLAPGVLLSFGTHCPQSFCISKN